MDLDPPTLFKLFAKILELSGDYCDGFELKEKISKKPVEQYELSFMVNFDDLVISQHTKIHHNGAHWIVNSCPAFRSEINKKLLINTFKQFQFATLSCLQLLQKACKSNEWTMKKALPKQEQTVTITVDVFKSTTKIFEVSFTMNEQLESFNIAGSFGVPVESKADRQIEFHGKKDYELVLTSASQGWD